MVSGGTRFGGAWVLSAAVHALAIALLLRRSISRHDAPRVETSPTTIAIELTEPPREFDERGEPPRAGSSRAGPRTGAAPRLTPAPLPARGAPAPSSPSPAGAAAEAPSPAPAPVAAPAPAAPVDLSLGALPDEVRARVAGGPADASSAAHPSARGRWDLDQLRADIERAEDAVANVRAGRADPLLYDYLRDASARFRKEAQRLADDLDVSPAAAARGWGRGYLARVADANRGAIGARADAPREGGGDSANEISPHADVLGEYAESRRQAEEGAEVRRAEVCMDVAPGRETITTLRRSAGNAALDRLAVDSFRKAAAARPVPAGTPRGIACYELRISAFRVPPLPAVGCAFDLTGATCYWPFKKVSSVKSQLLSVESPPGGGAPPPRSLLRRPR